MGAVARHVRLPEHLEGIDGLIVPGGESTTIGQLMQTYALVEPIRRLAASGAPIWGTCAGLILMATDVGADQPLIGLMDVTIQRNAFGRQLDSFETDLEIDGIEGGPYHAVFIRAPVVTRTGPDVTILARLEDNRIVAVRQNYLLGTAFHPELTDDLRMHRLFVDMACAG